jgi:hypothetical protein
VATALVHGATAFVTNDRQLTRLAPVLDIITLDDFAAVGRGDSSLNWIRLKFTMFWPICHERTAESDNKQRRPSLLGRLYLSVTPSSL